MKPNLIRKILIFALLVSLIFATGCEPQKLYTEEQFKLHTLCQITTFGKLDQTVYDELWNAMDTIDNTMSTNQANSFVKAINDAAGISPVVVPDDVFYVVEKALEFSDRSNKFDVSIGPVVALWGIGTDSPKLPDKSQVDEKVALMDYKKIQLNKDEKSIYLPVAGMMIDLGAIAKGFAADRAKEILIKNKVKQGIINFGGNIHTIGTKQNSKPWQIGIQHPDQSRGAYIGIMPLSEKTIVTSGIYERYFEENGKRYHHLLDTSTGYPINNGLVSVSVISKLSIDADALSTLIFAEGLERGLAFIESMDNIEAIFVTTNNQIYLSSGVKNLFQLSDDTYVVMP